MKAFWAALMRNATKLAVYAADHPDQVIAVVQAIQAVRGPAGSGAGAGSAAAGGTR
jgi:hypothetical protein